MVQEAKELAYFVFGVFLILVGVQTVRRDPGLLVFPFLVQGVQVKEAICLKFLFFLSELLLEFSVTILQILFGLFASFG